MKPQVLLIGLVILTLAACGPLQVGVEPTPTPGSSPSATQAPTLPPANTAAPSQPPTSTAAPIPPTEPVPTATSEPPAPTPALPTEAPSLEPTAAGPTTVKIFLIALEDNGKSGTTVGCGDSAVPVTVEVPATQGVLKAALQALLEIKDQYYGQSGLYNALYQSDLQVGSVTIKDGKAEIHLTGSMMLGGECDNPRVEAQITQTALQFSTVQSVTVYLNDKTLQEALSLK